MIDEIDTGSQSVDDKASLRYDSKLSRSEFVEYQEADTSSNTDETKRVDNWTSKEYSKSHAPPKVDVFDVAAYILKKTGPITTMKLQKLVYYSQAWSLVWDEEPLFEERIEAWANGPVVRELFAFHRGMFRIGSVPIGNPDLLSADQMETIDAVVEYYGDKPTQWLIDLSHMEDPWQKARGNLPVSVRSNRLIPLDTLAEYYSSLPPEE